MCGRRRIRLAPAPFILPGRRPSVKTPGSPNVRHRFGGRRLGPPAGRSAPKWHRNPLESHETRPEMARPSEADGHPYFTPFVFAIASSFSARMMLRWSAASFWPSMPKATAISCE